MVKCIMVSVRSWYLGRLDIELECHVSSGHVVLINMYILQINEQNLL